MKLEINISANDIKEIDDLFRISISDWRNKEKH